jgi:serine/threonine-protein kinase
MVSTASLVDALKAAPILRPEQWEEVRTKYAPANPDSQELAKVLIRLRWISIYQAKKLLAGKCDELAVGQYLILDKLGEGGMGKVFKALQLSLNRTVALKVVRNSMLNNETALKRFRREVRSAAQLTHPNIVRVFDADQVGNRHFLAMEFIDGVDLGKLVKDRGPLPIAMACSYVRQAALGLQHAHDRGMVHRDIKPANLLVAKNEQALYSVRNVVKILDMGLARFKDPESGDDSGSTELTRTGTVVGTPDFMSPEQAKNSSAVDHRSDLYSLGCTLYYLLAGQAPFPKGNPLEKLLQHQMDAPQPIQFLRPDVPNEVATIVHCLLAKRPDDRFQSGAALAHALEPWCAADESPASQPTLVLEAEAVDPDSVTLETDPNDPFDFGADEAPSGPKTMRRPPPVPRPTAPKADNSRWVIAVVAVFVVFLLLGAAAVGIFFATRKKPTEPSPGTQEPPKTEPIRPVAKQDPPPARELEAVDKYLPDDTGLAAIFDVKQLQSSPVGKKVFLGPVVDELLPFRQQFGVDLPAVVERVILASAPDREQGSLIILQGKSLVTPRLEDALRTLAGGNVSRAGPDGPEVYAIGREPNYLATTETCLLLSSRRERIVEALAKRDGTKKTKFADPTVTAGVRALSRVTELPFARSSAIHLVVGLRRGWPPLIPSAAKVNLMVGIVLFDDRGMHFHTFADETESGKGLEFERAYGKVIAEWGRPAMDARLERIGMLLSAADAPKLGQYKGGHAHYVANVPARNLDDWLAPFLPKNEP